MMSWNIEGIKNHIFMLKDVLFTSNVDFIFLSEPQVYQCDVQQALKYLDGDYCYHLNSEDLFDPELPLLTSRSFGGTMALWRRHLDPYVEVLSSTSAAYLLLILKMPGIRTSVHVTIYLPTHGKDSEFVTALVDLRIALDDVIEQHDDPILFIRGDGNVNKNNKMRVTLLQQFKSDYVLIQTKVEHKTYHHFVGQGEYDSNIDIILHSSQVDEHVTSILCKNDFPGILSHHDIIMSKCRIPGLDQTDISGNLLKAPRCDHTRVKITWSEEGKTEYCQVVSPLLKKVREQWLNPCSLSSMSVLLSLTNQILSNFATITNKSKIQGVKNPPPKSKPTPKSITNAKRLMNNKHQKYAFHTLSSASLPTQVLKAKQSFTLTKKSYKQAVRQHRLKDSLKNFHKLDSILDDNPSAAYSYIKSCKQTKSSNIEKLTVRDKVYVGSAVCDGFYDSMSSLKNCDFDLLRQDPNISDQLINYEHILKICKDQRQIPEIFHDQSTKILNRMRKNVSDFYSITALHYINAGVEGLEHFNCLLNAIIADVNNATIEELNIALGIILFKGHGKVKTSDRSYRTISTCPFLSKCLDLYLRDLYLDLWNDQQANTQYQGGGSSHELASLLVTEVIQHSLNVSDKPVFMIALDAESAFDRCLRQILVSELYKAKVPGAAIIFINNRLSSRKTVYEWDGTKLGPAEDVTGFEQGGINSSDYYKLYNNEQLIMAEASKLGVDIGSAVISSSGQADDVLLASNDIHDLFLLVKLTELYCAKYRVKLEPKKTKLLVFSNPSHDLLVKHAINNNQISINNIPV